MSRRRAPSTIFKFMKYKKLVIFIPSIEGGGVEKNLFLISNYLANKKINVTIISADKNKHNRFNKNVNFIK